LEDAAPDAETAALRQHAGPLVVGAIFLVVVAVLARLAVGQSLRRGIAPVVAVVVAALVLLGAYTLRSGASAPVPPTAREGQ